MTSQIKQVAAVVRFRSFDTSTAEGRSQERYRRIVLSTLASVAARSVSMLTALISVPLTLSYLGSERYGLWITISSTIAMLAFADLGLGNGLINVLSEAHGKDDRRAAQGFVSSAFFLLSAIAALLAILFVAAYPFVPWERVFNIKSEVAIAEVGPAVSVFMACFVLNMPLGVVQRVQMGYQELFATNLWQGLGNLLGLGGVLLAIYLRLSLPWLVLAMMGAPLLATLLNNVAVFAFGYSWLRPSLHTVNRVAIRRLLKTGFLFFVLQIAGVLAFQSANIIIAQFLGADQVPQYAVPVRLFSVVGLLLSFVQYPLWPAYGEAIARRDIGWVRTMLWRSVYLGLALNIPMAVILVLFRAQIMNSWVGPSIVPSLSLFIGLALLGMLNSFVGPFAMFLNGANAMGFQVICSLLMGGGNLLFSILLIQIMGLPGVAYGSLVAQILFTCIPAFVYIPRLFSIWSKTATAQANLETSVA